MLRVPSREALVGDRYELENQVGFGGMGEIWQARHRTLGSRVAIKFLHPSSVERPGARERFLREAQLMAQVQTRRAVQVFDFGITEDDVPYLVMELVDGETLADKLAREGKLPSGTTARILGEVARGLEKAHAAGIVHRDLKPENVLLTLDEDGELAVKVADFGVAKICEPARQAGARRLTHASGLAGTPLYMAPEQLRGEEGVTVAADIWALGVCAYECLTGVLPFRAGDLATLLSRMDLRAFVAASTLAPWVPQAFDGWFDRACATSKDARFPSVRAAAEELSSALGVAPSFRSSGSISIALSGERAPSADRSSTPPATRNLVPERATLPASASRLRTASWLGAGAVLMAAAAAGIASRRLPPPPEPSVSPPTSVLAAVTEPVCAPAPTLLPASVVAPSPPPSQAPMPPLRDRLPPQYRGLPDDAPASRVSSSFKADPY